MVVHPKKASGKSISLWFGKFILSGIIAFIVLTVFCIFYCNVPLRLKCESGATDFIRYPSQYYMRAIEGFGYGRINNDGYFNTYDYDETMEIHTLILGSSHMDAYQVKQSETTASRLHAMFADKNVYNIGMTGHNFLICARNLEAAVRKYQPQDYVVIETQTLSFSTDSLKSALDGSLSRMQVESGKLAQLLQKNQYLRLLASQYQAMGKGRNSEDQEKTEPANHTFDAEYYELIDRLLQKMRADTENSAAKVIILYHPGTLISTDGTLYFDDDAENVNMFEELCRKNGLLFLDMRARFENEFAESKTLPYGFSNSSAGKGHLNKDGHAMVADELYKLMEAN